MKDHSSVRPCYRRPAWFLIALAACVFFLAPSLLAQCSDHDSPDSLGCPVQLPGADASSQDSPAVLNVQETPGQALPKADRSNESSASNSLATGPSFSEAAPGNANGPRTESGRGPEPPSEFQRFVTASTGKELAIFGASLFRSSPASFGPIDHGPAPQDMLVDADDELRIRIWGQVNFSANLRVSREGEIYLPKVGAVHVAGLPFSAISGHLRNAMERVYRNFDLSVDMGEIHSIQIYVSGMAHRPGEYTVSALSTLVDAIFLSGGPSASGSMRHIELKRQGKVVTEFDLYDLLIKGDKTGDMQLRPGDLLYIPTVGAQVALLGSVREAGIYELHGKESIDELLTTAGGKSTIASGAHLSLERIEDRARRRTFEISSDASGLATLLADGDILRIDPIASNYRETVTLRGSVANPGRFRWHEGMHLSELMPDRDSLVERDYWWRRTQLGIPGAEFFPSNENKTTVQSPAAQTNWNYAVIERVTTGTMNTTLIPFAPGKLILDHDASQDLALVAGDVVTIFAQSDIQIPINEQTKYVRLEGEFVHPGVYSTSPGDTLRSVVERAGGLTQQAYPFGAVFTRESTKALEQKQLNEFADRLEHQLERKSLGTLGSFNPSASRQEFSVNRDLVERIRNTQATGRIVLDMQQASTGDYVLPEMNLEDGDQLVVPFVPETVQVVGAVYNPHAFLFRTDLRADQYLHLAGGPNRDADRARIMVLRADGSVITRDQEPSIFARGSLDHLRLHPGDSIIVPEKNLHPSAMSLALAWTQALSQSGLTALEVSALK